MSLSARGLARKVLQKIDNRLRDQDPVRSGLVQQRMQVCVDPACPTCRQDANGNTAQRIIYVLPADETPMGGIKVAYRQCEILANSGVASFAFHPANLGFSCKWFSHHVKTLPVGHFNPKRDFLVYPEIWAALAADFCIPNGIHYAIYAQNGYLTHRTLGLPQQKLDDAYRHADLILAISADTAEMVPLAYPFVEHEKIVRLFHSAGALFAPGKKEKLITYMPRKLQEHSERIQVYLSPSLPSGWRLQAIDGLDEQGVAEVLARSSIFLAFSEMEGCPLPPIEAALSGNVVVGYTGQGAKEYFAPPVFREVANGDFIAFISQIRAAIADVETGMLDSSEFTAQQRLLAATFSVQNETEHLLRFAERVGTLMHLPRPAGSQDGHRAQ